MSSPISRRTFIASSGVVLAAAGLNRTARAADGQLYAYVGHGTEGFLGGPQGGGIDVFRVNMTDGSMTPVGSTGPEAADLNGDGMCVSADGRLLYCISRTPALGGVPGTGGGVYAFAINRTNGTLRHLNTAPSMGAMPTAVRIDKTNHRVVVSNHGAVSRVVLLTKKNGMPVIERPTDSATVALFPVATDGALQSPLDVAVFADTPAPGTAGIRPEAIGPMAANQIGPACHGIAFDRTQRWVIATDNGFDHLYVYRFSSTGKTLEGKSFPVAPGSAPRHISIHPTAPYFFITNEREPTVSAFQLDSNTGDVRFIQTISTVPDGFTGPPPAPGAAPRPGGASPSDIRTHPSGKFLYASNRVGSGQDSVAVFAIDGNSGRLTRVDVTRTGGEGQREINIDPTGKFLFSANSRSGDVTGFAIDAGTGKLTQTSKTAVARAQVIDFATI